MSENTIKINFTKFDQFSVPPVSVISVNKKRNMMTILFMEINM